MSESPALTVAQLGEILFTQARAGNGFLTVSATVNGERMTLTDVSVDPMTLSLNFSLANQHTDDIDMIGSKRLRWLFPRIGTNNDAIDVLKIDIRRTVNVEPLLVGFDGNRRGWSILQMISQHDGSFVAQEMAFVPADLPVPVVASGDNHSSN